MFKRSLYVFVLLIAVAFATVPAVWAGSTSDSACAQKGTSEYSVAGAWHYSGTGTVNGYNATDSGTAVVTTTGSVGNETVIKISMSGIIRNATTGQSAPYSFDVQTNTPFTGSFSVTDDGITETFTQTGENTMIVTARGTQTSTGYRISFNYDATKSGGSSSSGGGCSVSPFSYLSMLLLAPLILKRR
jgi:Synergist-CTERM protein sorting domain-containing protein